MMCDFIARTNWSNIKSKYFMDAIIIFNLSYYMNTAITVTFVNQATLCSAFFCFPPKYYLHTFCTIFHIDLYVFNIHMEISNGTNKLNYVKRLAVFQNKPFGIPYGRMNHLCHHWNSVCSPLFKTFLQPSCLMASSCRWKVRPRQISCRFHHFFWTWCDKWCCQTWLHPSNRGRWFFVWGSILRQAHCYRNQWNTALKEAAIVSKMRTLAITL